MTAYVDDAGIVWKGKKRFHLSADSIPELHEFAASLEIHPCWYHRGARHPHYDITAHQREQAIVSGARPVTQRELIRLARTASSRCRTEHSSKTDKSSEQV
jgi:hypothetical protein